MLLKTRLSYPVEKSDEFGSYGIVLQGAETVF
jgi:hypothetical protein